MAFEENIFARRKKRKALEESNALLAVSAEADDAEKADGEDEGANDEASNENSDLDSDAERDEAADEPEATNDDAADVG